MISTAPQTLARIGDDYNAIDYSANRWTSLFILMTFGLIQDISITWWYECQTLCFLMALLEYLMYNFKPFGDLNIITERTSSKIIER